MKWMWICFWLVWSTIKILVLNQLYYSYKMCLNHISTGNKTSWRRFLPYKNCVVCSEGKLWSAVSDIVINYLELRGKGCPRHRTNVHCLVIWRNIRLIFVWVSLATATRLLSFWISWWSILAGWTPRRRFLVLMKFLWTQQLALIACWNWCNIFKNA